MSWARLRRYVGTAAPKIVMAACLGATVALLFAPRDGSVDATFPALAVAVGSFGALVVIEHWRPSFSARTILVVGGALLLVAVIRPPHRSNDVWSYAMYGRILAVHHHNPYTWIPASFPSDPFLQHVAHGWRATASVYGPVFNVLAGGLALVARGSPLAARVLYQALAGSTVLGTGIVLARRGVPTWALAAIVLNPLVVIEVVNGGHNDALVGAALLAAALASAAVRPRGAVVGASLAIAIGVKAVALLPAAGAVLWLWRKHGTRVAGTAAAVATLPVAAGYLLFGGTAALRPLIGAAGMTSRATIWRLEPVVAIIHDSGLQVRVAALAAVAAVTIAAVLRQLRAGSPAGALAAGAMAYLAAAAYVLPWYLVWALPVAALASSTRLFRLLVAQSCVLLVAYEYQVVRRPDALDRMLGDAVTAAQVFALLACVTLLVVRTRDDHPLVVPASAAL